MSDFEQEALKFNNSLITDLYLRMLKFPDEFLIADISKKELKRND